MLLPVVALGITQITAWGTTYYALGVLATPIIEDLGWSRSIVFFGFSVALLAMSAVSTTIGKLIDTRGARAVMSIGSVLSALGLAALALVHSETGYLLAWGVLGVAMRMNLYDAAFAALVQVVPSRGRRAISYLTLFGGFASSVFWPIGHYLSQGVGWRNTLLIYAALNLLVCLPLHWYGLSRREAASAAEASDSNASPAKPADPPLEGTGRVIGIALFAGIMSINSFVFGALSIHLVPVLEATGLAAAAAVWLASLKGVAQVGGRIVEMTWWRKLHPLSVARIALSLLPLSFMLLIAGGSSFAMALAFTLTMGASQGIVTIVRGAVPLALFGAKGYGAVLGLIATPILLVNALSPPVYALIVDTWGPRAGEAVLFGGAVVGFLGMEATAWWFRNRSR
jgi:predicted MFS family arabinose efflux permease